MGFIVLFSNLPDHPSPSNIIRDIKVSEASQSDNLFPCVQAVSVIKSLGGNVKMLVTNPKEEEEGPKAKPEG